MADAGAPGSGGGAATGAGGEGADAAANIVGEAAEETEPHSRDESAGASATKVEEPDRLMCPVTQAMFRDPVFVPQSGNTYERAALEHYWATSLPPRDPLTNVEVTDRTLHVNWMVRREVQQFLEDHPGYLPQGWPSRDVPSADGVHAGRSFSSAGAARALSWASRIGAVVAVILAAAAAAQLSGGMPVGWMLPPLSSSRPPMLEGVFEAPPKGSGLNVTVAKNRLVARLPPGGIATESAGQLFFSLFWLCFTGCWTYGALSGGAPAFFTMFSLPFWGVGATLLWRGVQESFFGHILDMRKEEYVTCRTCLAWEMCDETAMVSDLVGAPLRQCGSNNDHCEIIFEDGVKEHTFGGSLRKAEAEFLQRHIVTHLAKMTAGDSRFTKDNMPSRTRPEGRHQGSDFHHHRHGGGFHVTAGGFGPGFGVVIR